MLVYVSEHTLCVLMAQRVALRSLLKVSLLLPCALGKAALLWFSGTGHLPETGKVSEHH